MVDPDQAGLLGIECGGTRTVALLVDASGNLLQRCETGPANLRLLTDPALLRHFRQLASAFPRPAAIGIGMAGARSNADRQRAHLVVAKVWPGIACRVTHDLDTALLARSAEGGSKLSARVIVLSGTGSCCFGRSSTGQTARIGGWGQLLGDKGSGYEIGLRALRAIVYYLDRDGRWSLLGQRILRALQLNQPEDLIHWTQKASKADIAALAIEVFSARKQGEKIARDILIGAAHSLARDAADCARRLAARRGSVEFILSGGVMLKQPGFARAVARNLRKRWPKAVVRLLNREGAWGAVELAREAGADLHRHPVAQVDRSTSGALPTATTDPKGPHSSTRYTVGDLDALFGVGSVLTQSPTEQRNPRSTRLDKLSLAEAIRLLLEEEAKVPGILLAESKKIESAVRWIVRSFHDGGRLFYVGAGTSGRLGVLDASECPPTFRCPPEQVQGIIAGGSQALWNSIEGAEDDGAAGADAVKFRGVRLNDVVVGIAASGRTPFVWGAMIEAKKRGAKTILICFNPYLRAPPSIQPNLIIAPNLGPEVLTGSTRLKSGTATKLILNIFTTLAMVRMGKVVSNLMVDLNPSNAKLRDRAVRIVQELNRVDYSKARAALERCRWVIKSAHRWLDAHPGAPATQKVRVPRREATARR